jgi:peptidoglycan hydrolase-like protein with peptidoglycan-binding domain
MTKSTSFLKTPSQLLVGTSMLLGMALCLPLISHAATFDRQLELGMSGTDVSSLQTYLAQDATIYPQGLVTGYFGFLTKSAVSNFQSRNGIDSVGRVGPITLVALNAKIGGGVISNGAQSSMISNVSLNIGRNTAVVSWNTNDSSKGVVYYSTSPLTTYEHENSVDVSGNTAITDTNYRTSQSVSITGLLPNTTYYYLVYTTNQSGNVSVTWPASFQTSN